ncbi:1706_t:CDS:2 [Ambispora gerdemannii]|uniref:1706_t:CDS:1 n=1 Tax=Ambispora gerdemannii TaxID=144530 RepID=A0A9N9GNL2_9GLOM|nr:1706_t:CDS:2 [Ambispora gerdemannii]
MQLKNKVFIITGAASGFGEALSQEVVRKGAKVVLADINVENGKKVAEELNKDNNKNAVFTKCDTAKHKDIVNLFVIAEKEFGGVDVSRAISESVVVNNAGIGGIGIFYDQTESWKKTIDVNLTGVIEGTQLAIPYLKKRGGGVIINTASMSGLYPLKTSPVYAATKHGIIGFTRSLSHLERESHIRVNAVAPFFSPTALLAPLRAHSDYQTMFKGFGVVSVEDVVKAMVHCVENDTLYGDVITILPNNPLGILPKI